MTEKKNSEPSMNEILASIRQIMSEPQTIEEKPKMKTKEEVEEDILDLTNLLPDETNSSSPHKRTSRQMEKVQGPRKTISHPVDSQLREGEVTLNQDDLMRILKEQRQGPTQDKHETLTHKNRATHTEQTFEDLVRDSLNPLIKDWLNDHLPSIVNEVVNEQVAKMLQKLGK